MGLRSSVISTFLIGGMLLPNQLSAAQNQNQGLSDEEFQAAEQILIPFVKKPDMIKKLRKDFLEVSEAVNNAPVKVTNGTVIDVSLEPGSLSPSIVLPINYVTGLRVIDSVGNPWPITSKTGGRDAWFDIQKLNLEPHNRMTLNALSPKAHSNFIITLKDLNQLLSISVMTSDLTDKPPVSDGVILRISGLSPLADSPKVQSAPAPTVDPIMMSVLNNIQPSGAVRIKTDNPTVTVWRLGSHLYVRTDKSLRWPAFISDTGSGDVFVYKTALSSRLILADDAFGKIEVKVDI
jgi:hypothetical protein